MDLTDEQKAIIGSAGNIKINAVAGSGKTTTLLEYARARHRTSRILYVAFNRSVRVEATQRFAAQGINNVTVETAHSLAFKHVVPRNRYRVRPQGYKPYEIAEMLAITGGDKGPSPFLVASHVSRLVTFFCNSTAPQVRNLTYLNLIQDATARAFVEKHYDIIESYARVFLGKMDKGDIEVTHDFYLKKFQLGCPKVDFDVVLLDEGQDLSPVIVDTFSRQRGTNVIVGDAHQQIYSWRHAVNAIENVDCESFSLSVSFRFGQEIADLATSILDWKSLLGDWQPVRILGKGSPEDTRTKAVLARTNLGLLLNAIGFITESGKNARIYFEGNLASYAYAEDGTHLYDVLSLFQGRHDEIKSAMLKQMKDFGDLEEYVDLAEDGQLRMMVEIVKTYKARVPKLMKELKAKHIADEDKHQADMIFSTVHKSKGMEYGTVHIVDDFVTPTQVMESLQDGQSAATRARLSEEINLLYVAATRAKNIVIIPETMVPDGIVQSKHIRIVRQAEGRLAAAKANERSAGQVRGKAEESGSKGKSATARPAGANARWTPEQDQELGAMYRNGVRVAVLAKHFDRTESAIRIRLRKLDVEP